MYFRAKPKESTEAHDQRPPSRRIDVRPRRVTLQHSRRSDGLRWNRSHTGQAELVGFVERVALRLSESCGQIQFSSYASLPLTIRAKSISPAPITAA